MNSPERFLKGDVYRAMVGPRGAEVNLSFQRLEEGKKAAVAFSPSCRGRYFVMYSPNHLDLWELNDRGEAAFLRELWSSVAPSSLMKKLLFSGDGKWLLCAAGTPLTSVLLWKEGSECREAQADSEVYLSLPREKDEDFRSLKHVDMSPDGSWLVVVATMVYSAEEGHLLTDRAFLLRTEDFYEALGGGRGLRAQEVKGEDWTHGVDLRDLESFRQEEEIFYILSETKSVRFLKRDLLAIGSEYSVEVYALERRGKWQKKTAILYPEDVIPDDETEIHFAGGRLFLIMVFGIRYQKNVLASPVLSESGRQKFFSLGPGVNLRATPDRRMIIVQRDVPKTAPSLLSRQVPTIEDEAVLLEASSLKEVMYWDKRTYERTSLLLSQASCGEKEEIMVNADGSKMAFWDPRNGWEYLGAYDYPDPKRPLVFYQENSSYERLPESWSVSPDGKWLVSAVATAATSTKPAGTHLLFWDLDFLRASKGRNVTLWAP